MQAEEFKELLDQRPFVPLRIHMTGGKSYDIHHPDVVLVLLSRIDIGVLSKERQGLLARVEHCSLSHIVRVEELQRAVRKNGA